MRVDASEVYKKNNWPFPQMGNIHHRLYPCNMNEKVIYIYTCFNRVKESINMYTAVLEFIQVISKLWYEIVDKESKKRWIW